MFTQNHLFFGSLMLVAAVIVLDGLVRLVGVPAAHSPGIHAMLEQAVHAVLGA